jgi:hypothetical protein
MLYRTGSGPLGRITRNMLPPGGIYQTPGGHIFTILQIVYIFTPLQLWPKSSKSPGTI